MHRFIVQNKIKMELGSYNKIVDKNAVLQIGRVHLVLRIQLFL